MTTIDYDTLAQSSVDAYTQAPDAEKFQLYDLLEKAGYSPQALEKLGPRPDPGAPPSNPHIDPPSSLDGYRIKLRPDTVDGLDAAQVAAIDSAVKGVFYSAGVPQNMAQGLADTFHRTAMNAAKAEAEGEDALRMYYERGLGDLRRIYGEDKAKVLLADAKIAVERLAKLGKIFPNGAGSPEAVVSLAALTAVLRHRGLIK